MTKRHHLQRRRKNRRKKEPNIVTFFQCFHASEITINLQKYYHNLLLIHKIKTRKIINLMWYSQTQINKNISNLMKCSLLIMTLLPKKKHPMWTWIQLI
eukprot:UN32583